MGRKVHPIGFRLGINKPWLGRWYAEGKDYTNHLHQDLEIRKLVKKEADRAGVSDIEIERYPGKVKVTLQTAKPGILIGRKGESVKVLRQQLEALTGKKIDLEVKEIKIGGYGRLPGGNQYCRSARAPHQLPARDEACHPAGSAPGRGRHQNFGFRSSFRR